MGRLVKVLSRGLAAVVVVGLLAVVGVSAAEASHYYLTDVEYFSKEQIIQLRDNGIQTTGHFLAATTSVEARQGLAGKVKIDEQRLLEVARKCELLQLTGVGPKVVILLQEAGVTGVEDLAKREVKDLLKRVVEVNTARKITGIHPTEENITNWISEAKKATLHVK